jgi:hypothetical protein
LAPSAHHYNWNGQPRRRDILRTRSPQPGALGEVAEQLHDFRGETLADGKPDLLKKHLDRVAKVKSSPSAVARALKIRVPITIEGHIIFKNPVPMRFVADQMASRIRVSLFDELDRI